MPALSCHHHISNFLFWKEKETYASSKDDALDQPLSSIHLQAPSNQMIKQLIQRQLVDRVTVKGGILQPRRTRSSIFRVFATAHPDGNLMDGHILNGHALEEVGLRVIFTFSIRKTGSVGHIVVSLRSHVAIVVRRKMIWESRWKSLRLSGLMLWDGQEVW